MNNKKRVETSRLSPGFPSVPRFRQNPANTPAVLEGQPFNYNALTATANYLQVPSVSNTQFIDLTLFHEVSHYNGSVGNPDTLSVEQKLWLNCVN